MDAPNVEAMSRLQIEEVFSVVYDSDKQEELMNNPQSPNSWMLDFVYDSSILRALETRAKFMALPENHYRD